MTPAARIAAAIGVLEGILAGAPAEKLLTTWARRNRYAGSSDRAAIRDLVFDALRRRRSFGWLGGADSGRGLMIGLLRAAGTDPDTLFTGERYAPPPLEEVERETRPLDRAPLPVRLDCPDWLWPLLWRDFGADCAPLLRSLQKRAPVFLRVNRRRADTDRALAALAAEGIVARPHSLAGTALEVVGNARRIRHSAAYGQGLVELQDAASQAVVEALRPEDGQTVLDYCAGGGGKSLALGALARLKLTAHDRDPGRMADLPARARRAGISVEIADSGALSGRRFDLVLCDVPCSGSGSWRRAPQGKWLLDPARLAALEQEQSAILHAAAGHVRPGGRLAHVTCSLLRGENEERVEAFLAASPGWVERMRRRWSPLQGGDGFFLSVLERVRGD